MIVLTGGAGFIGSNVLAALNTRGVDDVVVVDDLSTGDKFRNIQDAHISDYVDKDDFARLLKRGDVGSVKAVLHQGACSDTMVTDGRYMMRANYDYSKMLFEYCVEEQVPFIYASSASVYGSGQSFTERPDAEQALNVYAYSKLLFDRYVRRQMPRVSSQVVGLRYFNVYGPREEHKGRMASVALHFFRQHQERGYVELFAGSGGYGDGEQLRDFVSVADVAAVNLHFLDTPDVSGIFNVGTGRARSFNDIAVAVLNAAQGADHDLSHWQSEQAIRYKPFPAELENKYQSFTQANLDALRQTGFDADFADVAEGVGAYVEHLRGGGDSR